MAFDKRFAVFILATFLLPRQGCSWFVARVSPGPPRYFQLFQSLDDFIGMPAESLFSPLSAQAIEECGSAFVLEAGCGIEHVESGEVFISEVKAIESISKVVTMEGLAVRISEITTAYRTFNPPLRNASSLLSDVYAQDVTTVENRLEEVWKLHRKKRGGVGGKSKHRLTKKELNKLDDASRDVIRNCYKRDEHVITSSVLSELLFSSSSSSLAAAMLLKADTETGGRFKRTPCYPLATLSGKRLLLLNGGWLAVDESMRKTIEASKFAQFAAASSPSSTPADERIVQNLESFALGATGTSSEDVNVSVDVTVREALKKMNLPLTTDGARSALIKMNRWSTMSSSSPQRSTGANSGPVVLPWSAETLSAAKELEAFQGARRKQLNEEEVAAATASISRLSSSFTIDNKRTSFRDDCVTLRPRSASSIVNGNRWEVVVSITDVSAVFKFPALSAAAAHRCMSRYDLPVGPLHLLPPVALESVSFKPDEPSCPNEAVSVVAYLDEKSGKIIDCRVERSLLRPKSLTYEQCNELLSGKPSAENSSGMAVSIIAKLLGAWSDQRLASSKASRQRDAKLTARAVTNKSRNSKGTTSGAVGTDNTARKGGGGGSFDRTPAHRLVDTSLDLYSYVATKLMRDAKG